ncbi:W2 domain containing protein [Trema orientale]|uniref:W2 domain containing protein n=1 Tax=Trema orientale TaxID=63057 RepID=A0A2P5D872_TREOI|nr:W2 domain containing protein [Trema orientale]
MVFFAIVGRRAVKVIPYASRWWPNADRSSSIVDLRRPTRELCKHVKDVITKWKKLLKYYLADIDEEIEVILTFEEMCLESAKELSPFFTEILSNLYNEDVIQEDAILRWDDEKKDADESDKVFVKQAKGFTQWLREASEEDDD